MPRLRSERPARGAAWTGGGPPRPRSFWRLLDPQNPLGHISHFLSHRLPQRRQVTATNQELLGRLCIGISISGFLSARASSECGLLPSGSSVIGPTIISLFDPALLDPPRPSEAAGTAGIGTKHPLLDTQQRLSAIVDNSATVHLTSITSPERRGLPSQNTQLWNANSSSTTRPNCC